MKLVTGIDLVDLKRFQSIVERYGERFIHRIYTKHEFEYVGANLPSLAARFAAKEAVSKALGTGIGKVSWQEIEISRGALGEPVLRLYGSALERSILLGVSTWSISLSHTSENAIALVVGIGL